MHRLDVAVVGAGPAGIGMARALQKVPGLKFGVLEAVNELRRESSRPIS
ncbi:lycopene cyclase family protein [Achromobacter denitrificans]|nr:lycopene cyclase family protein [Achromobacter denitrificans]